MSAPSIDSRRGQTLRRHLKAALQNTGLIVASLALFYLVSEVMFFRIVLPLVPFNTQVHLPEVPGILLQNTKSGYTPRNYVALLGDSYAMGLGDWLLENDGDRSQPFHTANIIHQRTGRDVVSFGKTGSGSAEGLVLQPATIFAVGSCYLFPAIEEPERIFYYFFEGNDLEDNRESLETMAARYGDASAQSIARFVNEQYGTRSPWRCHLHFGDTMFRMGRFLYQYHVQKRQRFPHAPGADSNELRIGNEVFRANALVGPALALADREVPAALSLYEPSLAWLRRRFPNAAVTVVYIPSPLTVYLPNLTNAVKIWRADKKYQFAIADPGAPRDNGWIVARSNAMCEHVRGATLRNGADFVDALPALRRAVSQRPIHGPRDWGHLNELGYRALGDLVAERVQAAGVSTACEGSDG